ADLPQDRRHQPYASRGALQRCLDRIGARALGGARVEPQAMMRLQPTPATALAGLHAHPAFAKAGRMSLARAPLLKVVEMIFEPLLLVASLWVVAAAIEGRLRPQYMILALFVFALTFPNEARLSHPRG